VERAPRAPEGRCNSLAHLLDVAALERAYHRQRGDAAAGVDGITKEQDGQNLEANLQDLHARLKGTQYRHQLIRRVHLPTGRGQTRPIGMSAFEDTLVQDAVREGLEAIYQGLLGRRAGLPARTQGPRRRTHPEADRRSG
jgi:retron-type reverse transcriptase